jgi:hypothetical protein
MSTQPQTVVVQPVQPADKPVEKTTVASPEDKTTVTATGPLFEFRVLCCLFKRNAADTFSNITSWDMAIIIIGLANILFVTVRYRALSQLFSIVVYSLILTYIIWIVCSKESSLKAKTFASRIEMYGVMRKVFLVITFIFLAFGIFISLKGVKLLSRDFYITAGFSLVFTVLYVWILINLWMFGTPLEAAKE